MMKQRFPFLSFPLKPLRFLVPELPQSAHTRLFSHLQKADYSVRLLRYWWAGQALKAEAKRLGRPLTVVDLGCERGWLKHFTPAGSVDRWIGLDWNPREEVRTLANYDEVHHANFDDTLPVPSQVADAVVSLHVFEHLPRPGSTIAEISRLLRPGGIFLGGSPTMPHWLAQWRERYFRRRLQKGQIAHGGHITVLSPTRWRHLAEDAGLDVEFLTGSHLVRRTGHALENQRWWIRLNQIWGSLFPSLGSEAYLQARRQPQWVSQTDDLSSHDPHWRGLWVGLGAAALLLLMGAGYGWVQNRQDAHRETLASWLDAHQKGGDVFILGEEAFHPEIVDRHDTHPADSLNALSHLLEQHPDAHVLVSLPTALDLINRNTTELWQVDSRLDLDEHDYLLLKKHSDGTPLHEYLLGAVHVPAGPTSLMD